MNSLPLNNKAWYEFPNDTTQDLTLDQVKTIAKKASLFRQLSSDSISSQDLFKHGLEYAFNIHEALINRRQQFSATEGRLFLSEEFRFVYEQAIEYAYLLYEIDPNREYFLEGLKFTRLSKSILFLEQSSEYEKVNNNIVDQELKKSFSLYKSTLDQLENSFYQLIDADVTSDSLFILNDSLSDIRTRLDSVMIVIQEELNGANWVDIETGFQENLTRIEEVKGQIQIEYFYGERFIYVLAVGKGQEVFHRIPITDDFEQQLVSLINQISNPPTIATFNIEQDLFAKNAHGLYMDLLEPVLSKVKGIKNLVLIPDLFLTRLPFEVLLAKDNREEGFDKMDFLIKDYKIRYELSSLLDNRKEESTSKRNILGLGFTGSQSANNEYLDLPGTEEEINFLKASYEGTYLNSASKEQFIELSSDYDILHLAVHGTSDTLNKYDSRLIFSRGDERELKTADLYLAGLNARLAILSACESGLGTLNKGEGTFSIARGFALAGVPSVVMSLWKVNDKITSKLMESMYRKFIDEGESINASLEKAKREYLVGADSYFSHPYYWASFIQLGEDIDYTDEMTNQYTTFALVLVAFLLGIGILYKKRKRTL